MTSEILQPMQDNGKAPANAESTEKGVDNKGKKHRANRRVNKNTTGDAMNGNSRKDKHSGDSKPGVNVQNHSGKGNTSPNGGSAGKGKRNISPAQSRTKREISPPGVGVAAAKMDGMKLGAGETGKSNAKYVHGAKSGHAKHQGGNGTKKGKSKMNGQGNKQKDGRHAMHGASPSYKVNKKNFRYQAKGVPKKEKQVIGGEVGTDSGENAAPRDAVSRAGNPSQMNGASARRHDSASNGVPPPPPSQPHPGSVTNNPHPSMMPHAQYPNGQMPNVPSPYSQHHSPQHFPNYGHANMQAEMAANAVQAQYLHFHNQTQYMQYHQQQMQQQHQHQNNQNGRAPTFHYHNFPAHLHALSEQQRLYYEAQQQQRNNNENVDDDETNRDDTNSDDSKRDKEEPPSKDVKKSPHQHTKTHNSNPADVATNVHSIPQHTSPSEPHPDMAPSLVSPYQAVNSMPAGPISNPYTLQQQQLFLMNMMQQSYDPTIHYPFGPQHMPQIPPYMRGYPPPNLTPQQQQYLQKMHLQQQQQQQQHSQQRGSIPVHAAADAKPHRKHTKQPGSSSPLIINSKIATQEQCKTIMCKFFHSTDGCRNGDKCRFSHEDVPTPTSAKKELDNESDERHISENIEAVQNEAN